MDWRVICMRLKYFLFLSVSAGLTACASNINRPMDIVPSDKAEIQLAEAATSVSHSLDELARIQAVATPPAKGAKLPDPASYGLEQRVSIDWAGPITPVLSNIATAGHYKLRIIGTEPATAIIVSIMAKNAPLGDILRDVAFQAGHKADVKVYPKSKVIELRYAKT